MSKSVLNFGQNVIFKLIERKKKMKDLAEVSGCTISMISKIVACEKLPSLNVAFSIANYFDCTIDDLLKGQCESDESV